MIANTCAKAGTVKITWSCSMSRKQQRHRSVMKSRDCCPGSKLSGQTYSVPTVPLDTKHLSSFSLPDGETTLRPDGRFTGKVKWYVKPIVFGGDASFVENVALVSHEEHAQLVKWWNDLYRSLKAHPGRG
jgi:hypothetical protein